MKFRPLHDSVLIKVLDSEEKTAGGIIIPDTAKEKPQEGEVVAVGPGAKNEDGKIYDKFRERGIFPIHSYSGKIIGFGGRSLHNGEKIKWRQEN